MFSEDRLEACTVCSNEIQPMKVLVCESCMRNYFPNFLCHTTRSSSHSTCQCCLGEIPQFWTNLRTTLWTSTCIKCRMTPANKGDDLAFLRHLKSSPLSEDFLGDVSFIVEASNKPIQAHRFILASKSRVFQRMMELDMNEKSSGEIRINDISAPALRAAVNFMYTAEVTFSNEVNARELLRFAHKYEVSWLLPKCENELMRNITKENVLEMLLISYRYEAERLKNKAREFFTGHPDIHNNVLDGLFANSY